jgi:tetratricopeptide (TPR) repeat protein
LIEVAGGDLRVVDGEAGLRDLVAHGLLTPETRVYEVGPGPRPAGEIPALARWLPEAETSEPPPVRAGFRSPERALLSEELAVLNRPLEDEEEFYEELPRSRLRLVVTVAMLFGVAGLGGYLLLAYRHRAVERAAATPVGAAAPISARVLPTAPGPSPSAALIQPSAAPPPPVSTPPAPPAEPPLAERVPDADPPRTVVPAASPTPDRSSKSFEQLISAAEHLLDNGRTRQAEALYRQALAERPRSPGALTGLGYTCLDRGQTSKAIDLFKQAIAADREYALAVFGLGEAYREQGKPDRALQAFKQYLTLKPSGRDSDAARRQIEQLVSSGAVPPA